MAVRVGSKIKPMNDADFKIADASDIEGLSTVATTGTYSSLLGKPTNVGSNMLPIYFNSSGVAESINGLTIGNFSIESGGQWVFPDPSGGISGIGSEGKLNLETSNGNASITLVDTDNGKITLTSGSETLVVTNGSGNIGITASSASEKVFGISTSNSYIEMSDSNGILLGNDGGGKISVEDCPLQVDQSIHVGYIDPYPSGVKLSKDSNDLGVVQCDIITANEDTDGVKIQTKDDDNDSYNAYLYLSDEEHCELNTTTPLSIDSTNGVSSTSIWDFKYGSTNKVSISPASSSPLSVSGSINAQGINIGNSSNATYGGSFSNNGILTVGYTNNYGIINVKNNSNSNAIVLNGNSGLITCSSLTLNSQDVSTYVLKNLYTKGSTGSLYVLKLTRASTNTWSTPCTLEYTTHESSTNWWIRTNSGTGSWYLISGAVECDPTGTITGSTPATTLKFMSITPLKFSTTATTCVGLFVCMRI